MQKSDVLYIGISFKQLCFKSCKICENPYMFIIVYTLFLETFNEGAPVAQ
jgi:hypothetical protein